MTELAHLKSTPAALLEQRTLLDRVDTKFIMRPHELSALIQRLDGENYGVTRHSGGAAFSYENVYFDTPERALLRAHHRGQRPRYKIRIRHYLSREMSFFEVKQKRPSGATTKERISVPFRSDTITTEGSHLLQAHHRLPEEPLLPAMRIGFDRIMLVGNHTPERVSIDTRLWFSDEHADARLEDLVIVEVKQARFAARSPIMRALRASGALQLRVSKYVTGAQLLWSHIRLNRYGDRLRILRRRIA